MGAVGQIVSKNVLLRLRRLGKWMFYGWCPGDYFRGPCPLPPPAPICGAITFPCPSLSAQPCSRSRATRIVGRGREGGWTRRSTTPPWTRWRRPTRTARWAPHHSRPQPRHVAVPRTSRQRAQRSRRIRMLCLCSCTAGEQSHVGALRHQRAPASAAC